MTREEAKKLIGQLSNEQRAMFLKWLKANFPISNPQSHADLE